MTDAVDTSSRPRSPLWRRLLLASSLVLNVALLVLIVAFLARRGGVRYLAAELGLRKHEPPEWRPFQKAALDVYRQYGNADTDVYFVGDSITADTPFDQVFGREKNRGIGGDTTTGVFARLDEVTGGHPAAVFLMIGTNDVARELPVSEIVDNYRSILRRLKAESPNTKVFVESVLPVADKVLNPQTDRNADIRKLNPELAKLAAAEGVTYVDVTPAVVDADGNLKKELTTDGLHLNLKGRLALCEALRPYVTKVDSNAAPTAAP